jgi:seryl-tRNA synthetase
VTLRTHGETPTFDFAARDHLELGELLGAIDMERGTKVSGSRFYFLTGIGARLELAIMSLGLDRAMAAGFTPIIPPTVVRPEVMRGTGFLGQHADEVYHLEEDDLYLVGTSEVPLAGYHMDEIIDLSKGAKRYAGWSTCYRREAGSYGKDTRGIIRVHQFNKLEMFVYTTVEDAEAEHLRLVALQEGMLQDLGLSYRVIDVAAGDLGSSAARKYDVEAWVPTQGAYRELTSTSNCTTYQARRLDIRHRLPADQGGKTRHVATLNGTLATTRWIVAILETHQRADGSVAVPEVLRPYLGGLDVIEPTA